MPVIIDELDLVDTEPDATPVDEGSAPHPTATADDRVMTMLRLAAQRAARVRAD